MAMNKSNRYKHWVKEYLLVVDAAHVVVLGCALRSGGRRATSDRTWAGVFEEAAWSPRRLPGVVRVAAAVRDRGMFWVRIGFCLFGPWAFVNRGGGKRGRTALHSNLGSE
jgi:hypothetical protein